jgi:formylmethanofuran dehydrogenase subunit E
MNRIRLWGSPVGNRPFRKCDKCQEERAPEGGIEIGKKWMCARCWGKRTAHK